MLCMQLAGLSGTDTPESPLIEYISNLIVGVIIRRFKVHIMLNYHNYRKLKFSCQK